ncbi:MAG: HAMP domain-containing histidine kinase [Deltaproteobacteria bacterium]|nr:HAMP domain-containing histidine kinase [Deltaproteobacteria bacterium]
MALLALVGYLIFGRWTPPDLTDEGREARARIARALVEMVAEAPPDPESRRQTVTRLYEATELYLAVFASDGTLLAQAGESPAGTLGREDLERLHRGETVQLTDPDQLAVGVPGAESQGVAYGIVRFSPRFPFDRAEGEKFRWLPPLLLLVGLLALLAVVSLVFVRSLAGPIRRLSQVARAFGDGDTSARAHLDRRDELGDLGRAFDEMADRLVDTLRGQTELLANASHELRTPLARIQVALDIAAEGDAALAREQLGEIATDLTELEALVSDILLMARLDLERDRLDGPRQPLRLESLPAQEVVEAAVDRFRRDHPERELRIETEAPGRLRGDRALLRRVLANLLENAAKYSDADRLIVLRAHGDAERVVLEVSDEGIGIAPEDLERIFMPFFRTDRSRSRSTGGIGLGLALARRVVEAHGGTIVAENAQGGGTTFRVTLPAES